jgi:uncharacterized RDD family membrane protein YckC
LSEPVDTLIRAETPEGISLAMRPAGLAARSTAFIIDATIRAISLSVLATVLGIGGKFSVGLIFIVIFLLNWLYPVIFEMTPGSATPGKRIMGLQVMMANGLPITPAGSLIRNLMRFVDALPVLYAFGIISVLLRDDARRLGDIAGGTVVVYRDRIAPPLVIQDIAPVAPRTPLSAQQRAAITAFAWRAERLTTERAEEIAALAGPIIAPGLTTEAMSARIIAVARWLHGQRRAPPATP